MPSSKPKGKGTGKGGKTFLKGKQVKKRVAVLEDGTLLEYDSDETEHYGGEGEEGDRDEERT